MMPRGAPRAWLRDLSCVLRALGATGGPCAGEGQGHLWGQSEGLAAGGGGWRPGGQEAPEDPRSSGSLLTLPLQVPAAPLQVVQQPLGGRSTAGRPSPCSQCPSAASTSQ